MKFILFLFFSSFLINSFAQKTATPYIASTSGIGNIKLGMKVLEVEKLTGQSIVLKKLQSVYDTFDTIQIHAQDDELTIVFKNDINEDKQGPYLYSIESKSPLLKTKSGIGIGDDNCKIINTYSNYPLWIYPVYETETRIDKDRSTITLIDLSKSIIFSMTKNILTSITVEYQQNGD